MSIKGKKVAVFGASSGVGAALVPLIQDDVDRVYAISRRGAVLDDQQKPIDLSDNVEPMACDVRHYPEITELFSALSHDVDIIVSCVGVGFFAPLNADYSSAWKNIFDTNVVGNINILSNMLASLPECKQAIVLGSIAAKRPSDTPGNAVYRASKIALATFLSDFRIELRGQGNLTKICNIEPGFIEGTDFGRRFFETNPSEEKDLYQAFDSLTAQEVAEVIKITMQQSENMDIGEIVLRPVMQPK